MKIFLVRLKNGLRYVIPGGNLSGVDQTLSPLFDSARGSRYGPVEGRYGEDLKLWNTSMEKIFESGLFEVCVSASA